MVVAETVEVVAAGIKLIPAYYSIDNFFQSITGEAIIKPCAVFIIKMQQPVSFFGRPTEGILLNFRCVTPLYGWEVMELLSKRSKARKKN